LAGANLTYAAVDQPNGNLVPFGRKPLLSIKNANAAICTVTLKVNGAKAYGTTIQDQTVSVPANTGNVLISGIDPTAFNQQDGNLYLDFSVGASVTIAVVEMG